MFLSGEDIAALRRFVGLTQAQFALAMGISVHTLRNWEQGRRHPEGPAIALLRIAARQSCLKIPAIRLAELVACRLFIRTDLVDIDKPNRSNPSRAAPKCSPNQMAFHYA